MASIPLVCHFFLASSQLGRPYEFFFGGWYGSCLQPPLIWRFHLLSVLTSCGLGGYHAPFKCYDVASMVSPAFKLPSLFGFDPRSSVLTCPRTNFFLPPIYVGVRKVIRCRLIPLGLSV